MLNVGRLNEGVVLDHIEAGKSMSIYKYLKLDKMDCCVAIIKNAHSNKMGKKDIIKVECPIDELDLNVLGFIDHRITVNIIQNGTIVAKKELNLPKKLSSPAKTRAVSPRSSRDSIRYSSLPTRSMRSTAASTVKKNIRAARRKNKSEKSSRPGGYLSPPGRYL